MDNNLSKLAQANVISIQKSLKGKQITSNFYITSFHSFSPLLSDYGYDWFFVTQDCFLNGANDYVKEWAGTRRNVEGTSWYVGQGEVCLNYVDSYQLKSYIHNADQYQIVVMDVNPISENSTTSCTSGIEFTLGGQIGFEAGKESKGNGSFSTGVSLSESYSFDIRDCTVRNNTGVSGNNSSVEWIYSFRRARKNTSAGKWQRLIDPADLSHSTFTPTNLWIWKIPTKYREVIKSFTTDMTVNTINTITRNSGSADCKHVEGRSECYTQKIDFSYPPLLIADVKEVKMDKQAGTFEIHLTSEMKLDISKGPDSDWFTIDSSFEENITHLWVTVKELPENLTSRKSVIKIEQTIELVNQNHKDSLEIPVVQVQALKG